MPAGDYVAESTRDEQIDLLTRGLRESRTGRPTPATDGEWARTKARFPGNYLALRAEADRMVADGTLYED
ncbi:MAG: hypothetical protein M3Y35_17545 [Actinomycetota bacterium]|nr:hypothetical protein [Actinomycetota bacterium]